MPASRSSLETPIRQQYLKIKQRYPDALLLFRLGDFYETFEEDARVASQALEIVLTSRSMGRGLRVPMAGIPAHALESYLGRLIKQGYKVAVCEQLTDPATSRGLVERGVVRVVTPGTVVEPSLLEQKSNNYLAALTMDGDRAGLAYVDITTGEFATAQMDASAVPTELERLSPAEVIVSRDEEMPGLPRDGRVSPVAPSSFNPPVARRTLLDQFGVVSLEAFGCEDLPLAIGAAGAIVEYLADTQRAVLSHLATLTTYSTSTFMTLDSQTRRNLELFQGGRWGQEGLSLLATLDFTRTPMGGRLLRRWLGQPLLDLAELARRQDGVAFFYDGLVRREKARSAMGRITDVERVLSRVRLGTAVPRELLGLKTSLEAAAELVSLLEDGGAAAPLSWLSPRLRTCPDVVALIDQAILSDPSGLPGDGDVVRPGFSPELDEVKSAARDARQHIAGIESAERERTGIHNLKVGYNRVFGYYIEVSNTHRSRVPDNYIRRQTLVGGERYITPELKEHESLVLTARERAEELEKELYRQVCSQIAEAGNAIGELAVAVAHLDVFAALAEAAARHGYVRPQLNEGGSTDIRAGRHPVVERVVQAGTFVPNDTHLAADDDRLVVLTGPNMSGKSTYIRQAALITLMAQMGSFVPADSATLGLVDRIFTRVGLQDDLATGHSTFMVEMVETAAILNQATSRSLVVLDEIGRGTSTYDGLSIARAVVEYLHNHPRLGCRALFATHYHELTELAKTLPGVRNYAVAVTEDEGRVVFLHRIVPGSVDRSYGVQVARLAGLPAAVTNRAWEILKVLEEGDHTDRRRRRRASRGEEAQLPLLAPPSRLAEELLGLDVSNMTPLEALNMLYELQRQAQEAQ